MRVRKLAVLMLTAAAAMLIGCEPRPGKLRSEKDHSNGTFLVRIELHDEANMAHLFESGCHIRLLSGPVGSNKLEPFGRAYFSRCNPGVLDAVRFVDSNTAYVYMQWWYAVTTDQGKTWTTFDVPAHLPGRVYYSPTLIENVVVERDGTGRMRLNPEGVRDRQPLTLETRNFGREWQPE
jgi:hypothetical protein